MARDCFLPEVAAVEGLEAIYSDRFHVTSKDSKGRPTSSSSQPGLMAAMLESLDIRSGNRVLEIGAGTGYNAALLAELVGARGRVVTVDIDPRIVEVAESRLGGYRQVEVVLGDGLNGSPAGGPFDRIIVTAEPPYIPRAWFDQLKPGGLLEVPIHAASGPLSSSVIIFRRDTASFRSVGRISGGFMAFRDSQLRLPRQRPSPPQLGVVGQASKGPSTVIAQGRALGSLSPLGRQSLAAALAAPWRGPLAASSGLLYWLGMSLDADEAVTVSHRLGEQWSLGVGLVDGDGDGLAATMFAWKGSEPQDAAGLLRCGTSDRGLRALRALARDWIRAGRPSAAAFAYLVAFDDWPADARWRLTSRGGSYFGATPS